MDHQHRSFTDGKVVCECGRTFDTDDDYLEHAYGRPLMTAQEAAAAAAAQAAADDDLDQLEGVE